VTEHFVTLFDCFYLPQGLALHASMRRFCGDFRLWVLCMDEDSYKVLAKLRLKHVEILKIADWETDELLAIKFKRSRGEYCWTLTPFCFRFVFESDSSIHRLTYIDADTWFCRSPEQIFSEYVESGKSVLITEHAYSIECDQSEKSGKFCVQFLIFDRCGGEEVRVWWEKKCLDWCYARHEDGKFGDQMYLDGWPDRFSSVVHVLDNKSLILAPWNAYRFSHRFAVIWHFHELRLEILGGAIKMVWIGGYSIPCPTQNHLYRNYIRDLHWAVEEKLVSVGYLAKNQNPPYVLMRILYRLRGWFRSHIVRFLLLVKQQKINSAVIGKK
jgi:hypothetical protein